MQTSALPRFFLLAWGALSASLLMAEEVLGPMGGVAGLQHQAESRVTAPVAPEAGASHLAAVTPPQVPQGKGGAGESWLIRAIALKGDVAFAEKEGVKTSLEADLVGDTPKNQQAVQEALRKVFKQFIVKKYYLARATLPRDAYDARTKTLTVLVEAGLFGETTITFEDGSDEGRWFSREQIAKKLRKLREGEPFDYGKLHEALVAINGHPDLTLDTKLKVRKPVEGAGNDRRPVRYADMDFTVKEQFPLHVVWDVNNYGTESINQWQSSVTLQYLNLTKADDVLTVSPAMSLDTSLKSVAASYMRPHDIWKGGSTTLYGGWSDLDTDDIVPNIDLTGTGWFVGLAHSYVLMDDDDRLVSLSAGIVYRYIEDQFSAFNTTLQERNVTVLPLSVALTYSARRPDALNGRNFATVQGIYNLMSGGDNDLEDMRVDAKEHYLIGRLQLARLQPLFGSLDATERQVHQWILFLKAEGQYASCNLIPAEELALGGHDTVRGYTTKGYFGDNGVYGTAELRTPVLLDFISGSLGRQPTRNPFDRLQFVLFTDMGYKDSNDAIYGETSDTLWSAGTGFRAAVTDYSQLRLDVAFPLVPASRHDDSAEYYLDWQLQF